MLRKVSLAAAITAFASLTEAWLPGHKIRGVNVGTMFVFEPWIDQDEWGRMGCSGEESEFDCVSKLGQDGANSAFQSHWRDWINESDLDEMMSYGLNTIRVPLGYWLLDEIVDSSERFPRGGLDILTDFVGKASDRGFYIIIDLHGGPGAQVANQPFTGQNNPNADFYNDYNYGRAVEWLRWMTEIIHTNDAFRNAGMLQVINEPLHWDQQVDSLRSQFYVDAFNAIRDVENSLNIADYDRVHIQMMSALWGSGDPTQYLPDTTFTAYDNHRYLKWDGSVPVDKNSYISTSCGDDQNAEDPLIVGEWSLSVPDNVEWTDEWNPFNDSDFYSRWFSAQVQTYERSSIGWVFWTWKANVKFGDSRGDPRWSYRDAVSAGLIPSDIQSALNRNVC